jgi:hypothetical protein
MPDDNVDDIAGQEPAPLAENRRRVASYPSEYVWFVFVSTLDIVFTAIVLHSGGKEVNPLANSVLMTWGLPGLVIFKFTLVLVVIGCCELLARQRDPVGRFVARFAVGISAVPIVIASAQLLRAAAS